MAHIDQHTDRERPRLRRGPAEMAALKREMLERARKIYRDEGVEALSMRRLAQELGISTMAIYSYFESKKALLDGLWIEVFEALTDELLDASKDQRAPRKVLEAHTRCLLDFWERHPEQFRMIYMSLTQTGSLEEIGQSQQPVYNRLLGLMRERVAACAPEGFEPDETAIRLICDQMSVRTMGYLMMVIGLPRYPLYDREALREFTVQGVLRDVTDQFVRFVSGANAATPMVSSGD
ncbi:TetR/AcrR family transcriptional regulator [Roseateles sp. 22389]|uniref:TetR/AcrR family transcriptional regulator n=1 Tax=Roseateles sp. 22389 TaxID=3453916 RepID=UPI0026358F74|nr:TetR/AcrR family transcriptional regulator [uncultured Roseateles sp.]